MREKGKKKNHLDVLIQITVLPRCCQGVKAVTARRECVTVLHSRGVLHSAFSDHSLADL